MEHTASQRVSIGRFQMLIVFTRFKTMPGNIVLLDFLSAFCEKLRGTEDDVLETLFWSMRRINSEKCVCGLSKALTQMAADHLTVKPFYEPYNILNLNFFLFDGIYWTNENEIRRGMPAL